VRGHARRQIATKRDNALVTGHAIVVQQGSQFGAAAAHAGQVRRHRQPMRLVQMLDRLTGVAQRRTPGAEGDRRVFRLIGLQRRRGAIHLGALFVGLGRKEFKADRRHRVGFRV
jgi:hypothetical protein